MTYMGSKKKYAKYICPILQKTIDDNSLKQYVEPCVGGANIIEHITCQEKIGYDLNKYLIALWKELQKPDFIFPEFPTREDWDRCKEGRETRDWYSGLVQIFCSYLARGFAGGFNTQSKQYYGRVHTVQKELPLIRGIDFRIGDYSEATQFQNACIYLDPPYFCTKKYDVSKNFDYDRFYTTMRQLSFTNYVYISEQQMPDDFIPIWGISTARQLQGNTTPCVENLYVYKEGLAYDFEKEQGHLLTVDNR